MAELAEPEVSQGGASGSANPERLALFYEGMLTAIVRVQSGRQRIPDSDAFRSRMKDALKEIAQVAARRGYTKAMTQEANFAVVAFLDEVVLSTHWAGHTLWARKSLQEELFEQRSAGELFFKHLEELRAHHDSPELAEVLEVYYLCLLLGYEGRYAAGSKAELHILMDNVRERIDRILGPQPEVAPDWRPPETPLGQAVRDQFPRHIQLSAAAALALALLCFFGFSYHLSTRAAEVERLAQQQVNR
jgi:type VI secretion system protein ImpK